MRTGLNCVSSDNETTLPESSAKINSIFPFCNLCIAISQIAASPSDVQIVVGFSRYNTFESSYFINYLKSLPSVVAMTSSLEEIHLALVMGACNSNSPTYCKSSFSSDSTFQTQISPSLLADNTSCVPSSDLGAPSTAIILSLCSEYVS